MSDIFTKTQKLGRIDRFQVSVLWTLEFMTKKSDIKEIARPENGTLSSRIQSVSLNFDMFVQCWKVTQLHDIDTENVSDRRLNSWSSILRAANFFYITSFG